MKRKNGWVLRISRVVLFVSVLPTMVNAQFLQPKPLPPQKGVTSAAALLPAAGAASPWQLLNNQPPVLDYVDCGPGTPLLLTDGTVMLADKGCQDWWKLTPDCLGSAGNGEATFAVSVEFRPFGAGIFKALGVYRPMTLVLCSATSAGVIGLSDQFKTGPFVVRPVARFSTRKFGARIA